MGPSSESLAGTAEERLVASGDYRALAEFRFLCRQFLATSAGLARSRGLTPRQHQILLALAGRPEGALPTIGYLADRLLIQHHGVVGLVDRLEAQGLVTREHSTNDRRQVLVHLTDRGLTILADLSASHQRELRSLGPRLVRALSAIADQT
ncbi:MAG TPA: MarR family transcriptional regulator [Thermomicrobiaceae bacterium]|nr:MarR family transcriptional regulator [Thermomicrobiaceae bacterium]